MARRPVSRFGALRRFRERRHPLDGADEGSHPGAGDERTPVPVGSALPQRGGRERRLLRPSERRRPAMLPARGVPEEDQGRGASSAAVGAAGGGAAARVHGRVPDALRLELRAGELRVRRADDRVAAVRGTEDESGDDGGAGGRGVALRPEAGPDGVVASGEVSVVKQLMDREAGRRARSKVRALQEAGTKTSAQDGSSFDGVAQVASKWKVAVASRCR